MFLFNLGSNKRLLPFFHHCLCGSFKQQNLDHILAPTFLKKPKEIVLTLGPLELKW